MDFVRRWSQKTERVLGEGARRETKLYNGYGDFVAHLYKNDKKKKKS